MARNQNQETEKQLTEELATGRHAAAIDLLQLFGGKNAEGKEIIGVLHQYPIATLQENAAWAKLINGVQNNPHAKTLAVVAACRGVENYSPTIVAELFSEERSEESQNWFSDVFMAGAAKIYRETGVSILVPRWQTGLNFAQSAWNVVSHISNADKTRLGLFVPNETPRQKFAADIFAIASETHIPLTAAQGFYRWAVNRHQQQEESQLQNAQNDNNTPNTPKNDDPSDALPGKRSKPRVTPPPVAPDPRVELQTKLEAARARKTQAMKSEDFTTAQAAKNEIARLEGELAALEAKPMTVPVAPILSVSDNDDATMSAITPAPAPLATDGKREGDRRGNPRNPLRKAVEFVELAPPTLPPVLTTIPMEPALPPPPTAAAPATTGKMDLASFVARVKATGASPEKRLDLVVMFGKNRTEAVELLEAVESIL